MKKSLLIFGLALSINAYSQDTITTAEVQKHIISAFDSVNLINQLNALAQPLSIDNAATKVRNVDHLKVMMGKVWFVSGLSESQNTTITALIQ